MVSKKTSNSEVKQTPAKSAPRKAAAKASATKGTAGKNELKPAKGVMAKNNVDVISEVLEIKAHNEEKQQAKAAKKTAKPAVKAAVSKDGAVSATTVKPAAVSGGEGIGSKAAADNGKRTAVKEKAQKAEAKKFLALKEAESAENCDDREIACCESGNGIFNVWGRAYKNIFNFKGRTSRYEFWGFMLVNFVLAIFVAAGIWSLAINDHLSPNAMLALSAIITVVEMLVYLSIIVRRLHDTGNTAWKGFFRPLVCWGLLWLAISICGELLLPDETAFAQHQGLVITIYAFYIASGLIYLFYGIKTFLAAAFFEEERSVNAYGAPMFYEGCFKRKVLTYASIYAILFFIVLAAQVLLGFYLAAMMMFGGGNF